MSMDGNSRQIKRGKNLGKSKSSKKIIIKEFRMKSFSFCYSCREQMAKNITK